MLNSRFR